MLSFYWKAGESICVHLSEQNQIIYKSIQKQTLSVLFPEREHKVCEIGWLRNS